MNDRMFVTMVDARLADLRAMMVGKGDEYASETDRLENFRMGAALERVTPEKYLLGLVAKHEVALRDFVKRLDEGRVEPTSRWLEKTGDIIIYMLLLEGLHMDRCEDAGEDNMVEHFSRVEEVRDAHKSACNGN